MKKNTRDELNKLKEYLKTIPLEDVSSPENIQKIIDACREESLYRENKKDINLVNLQYMFQHQPQEFVDAIYPHIIESIKEHIKIGDIQINGYSDRRILPGTMYETSILGTTISDIFQKQPDEVKSDLLSLISDKLNNFSFEKMQRNELEENTFLLKVLSQVYMDLPPNFQEQHREFLSTLIEARIKANTFNTIRTFKKIDKLNISESEKEKLKQQNETMEKDSQKSDFANIFRNTGFKFSREEFDFVVLSASKIYTQQDKDRLYSIYEHIYQYNKNINMTLNIDIIDRLHEKTNILELVRLTSANITLKEKLLEMTSNETLSKVLTLVLQNRESWDTQLSLIDKNYFSYTELFKQLQINNIELTEIDIKQIQKILMQRNYFNIQNIDELRNFENIKNEICQKILNDEYVVSQYPTISNTVINPKRFAILELLYGIDEETAINFTEKYGTDIDLINNEKFKNTINQIKNIKKIIKDINIDVLLSENQISNVDELKQVLHLKYGMDFSLPSIDPAHLDNECLNLYASLIREDFKKYSIYNNEQQIGTVQYKDTSIQIRKISPYKIINGEKKRAEISAFVRTEGAYAKWIEPENFREALDIPSVRISWELQINN